MLRRAVGAPLVKAVLEPEQWQHLSRGDEAQRERLYAWVDIPLRPAPEDCCVRALAIRRSLAADGQEILDAPFL